MNEGAPLSTAFDRLAAACCGALAGIVAAGVVTGTAMLLPVVLVVGSVLALPSMLLLAGSVEAVARLWPALHASFPVWLFAGLLATAPLMMWAVRVDLFGRGRLALAVGVAGLIGSIAAWGFYVRHEERMT